MTDPPGPPACPHTATPVGEDGRCLLCGAPRPGLTKINLPANLLVASEPASNLGGPAVARSVRLSLTVTVPETAAREVYSEMAEHAAELMVERGASYTSLDATVEEEEPAG